MLSRFSTSDVSHSMQYGNSRVRLFFCASALAMAHCRLGGIALSQRSLAYQRPFHPQLALLHRVRVRRARRRLSFWAATNVTGQRVPVSAPPVSERGIVLDEESETPFTKILCANRGEIAIRIFRAGTELGLTTVAIYAGADRLQPHRFKADESFQIGTAEQTPVASYLDVEGIIYLAKKQGVDAIHPGYGFLSENATFARRCGEEGIQFIGPQAKTIEAMGDKTTARRLAEECGVPVVPGTDQALTTVESARAFSKESGFPVILKAAMGGGGRGMRVVHREQDLEESFTRASNEAKAAFGDGRMFIERYVEDPRHIEIQILADHHGNVVHLYERDCSVQRRHQKVVEMAPAYGLDPEVRTRLHADAVKLAKHVDYRNAGTVEFMVDKNGEHFFLEVNPRIQVEHTVTEEVTGVDLVQAQIKIAGGAKLSDLGIGEQDSIPPPMGYAIQCRVTCEDPERNFQPDSGRIQAYRSPGGPGIRLDGAMTAGNVVSPYFDSLLVKVIASSNTFLHAVQKMQRALFEFHIRGIKTNILFLENVLKHPEFLTGKATTSFIGDNPQLFEFGAGSEAGGQSSKVLQFLADQVVNGPSHPGAVGAPPSRIHPALPVIPGMDAQQKSGWRDLLTQQGPEAWAKAVRGHRGLLLTDTTMRDAHQSLLATRVRTHDLLRAAPATGHVMRNAASLECWGGATFDVALRFLHEDPWRRLEALREQIPHIPFQMLLRGANAVGYTSYPDNVVYSFVAEAKRAGMDIFRIFDSLNYVDNILFGIDTVTKAGGVAEGTICYTGDITNPNRTKYTLDYYIDLAQKLVDHGIHVLGIKDMAGLLKPRAATMLISTLRRQFPDVAIHVHTHDSAGTGVATQIAAAEAGADIVDACVDSMSGMTSQPSMGAIVHLLNGTDLDTGIHPSELNRLSTFWEQTRGLYAPFESEMRSGSSDVYQHEMPGGQYTNLKFQALSLGLGEEWEKVKTAYAMANRVLGDIVKVTPSSKTVGDLAQFMVQNKLDEKTVVERADKLNFPGSVVEFLQGQIGQPAGGFPEPLRSRVLKDKKRIEGRPGASIQPLNLQVLESDLKEQYGKYSIDHQDVLSAALYPKVFEEFKNWQLRYSRYTEALPTQAFLAAMEEDDEIEVELSPNQNVIIKFKAVGELQPNGTREVFFETNSVPRVVEVIDTSDSEGGGGGTSKRGVREKADPKSTGSVGAPMGGQVIEVMAEPGTVVKAGQAMVVLSAMKMETAVAAPCDGVVRHMAVAKGDTVDAGDLLLLLKEGATEATASILGSIDL